MAMTTSRKPTTEAAPTLPDLQRAHDEAAAVVARLRAIDNPQRFGASGEGASPLDRLQARRDLPAAEFHMLETETALLEAKAAHESAERERRERALAEGRAFVRRELPSVVRELRAVQARVQNLAPALDEFDHRTGGHLRFGPAAWAEMRPGGGLDAWVSYLVSAFDLERE